MIVSYYFYDENCDVTHILIYFVLINLFDLFLRSFILSVRIAKFALLLVN